MENKKLDIRVATADDLNALMQIENDVFEDPWSRESLSSLFQGKRNVVLVACQENQIIGYITGWHVHDEAEIARLAVLPEVRRQGIASALIISINQIFDKREIKKISLEVRVSNKPGFATYRKFGFAAQGRRPRYYKDGEDALVMVKGEL